MPPLPPTPHSLSSASKPPHQSNNEPPAVYESAPVAVSWNTRDVLLFANSIGCSADQLHYLYEEHPSFTPFPTYPIVLTFKHTHISTIPFAAHFDTHINIALPAVPRLDSTRVVDGGRTLQLHRPLPASSEGREFTITTRVLSVTDKGKGKPVIVVLEHELHETVSSSLLSSSSSSSSPSLSASSSSSLSAAATQKNFYATITETAIYLAQGGFNGPTTPPRIGRVPVVPPRNNTPPDAEVRHRIPSTAHLLYRLNGDYNPLHADPAAGVKAGFDGEIMHGLYTWNSVARGIVERFAEKGEGEVLRCFEARFVSPTRPGDALRTECWVVGEEEGWVEVLFRTWVKAGGEGAEKVCLNGGRAVVKGRKVKSRM